MPWSYIAAALFLVGVAGLVVYVLAAAYMDEVDGEGE